MGSEMCIRDSEWHKAAFHNPTNTGSEYSDFAIAGNDAPVSSHDSMDADAAVFGLSYFDGPAAVTHAGGLSHYGVMGMSGNAWEWEESSLAIGYYHDHQTMTVRGGGWDTPEESSSLLSSTVRFASDARDSFAGFRLVSLEPRNVVAGDFNRDGELDASDIDLLSVAVVEQSLAELDAFGIPRYDVRNNVFDLNTDQFIDDVDRDLWLTHVAAASLGDSDLDGDVDFVDFLSLANNFGESPSSWSQGDYDGNNETNFLDFLALANNFGNSPVAAAAASVPEPSSSLLATLAVIPFLLTRKRRCV